MRSPFARGTISIFSAAVLVSTSPLRAVEVTEPAGAAHGYPGFIDINGKKLAGKRERSSEFLMHAAIYKARPNINAVIHAHPPNATAFAIAGIDLFPAGLQNALKCAVTIGRMFQDELAAHHENPRLVAPFTDTHPTLTAAEGYAAAAALHRRIPDRSHLPEHLKRDCTDCRLRTPLES